jgi:hypothetical protein
MRMWMVPPVLLCNKHLLGEHGEIHKHRHNFTKGHRILGRLSPVVQIEPLAMAKRHDDLASEMLRRGMNHKSPYTQPDLSTYPDWQVHCRVDTQLAMRTLSERCSACRSRMLQV